MAIGIFGGAFNPPHIEHINMIKELLNCGLEKVVVVPSNNPPHKHCNVSFNQRVDMLNIALLGMKNVVIDEIENRDEEVHYSYETIPKLKQIYGEDIVFVIGGDSLIDFKKWKCPEKIIKECPLWVFHRGDRENELKNAIGFWEKKGAKIRILDYLPTDLSSSLMRSYFCLGYTNLIDPKVERYIAENNLYRDFDPIIRKLSTYVEEKTFHHCIRTAKCALYLNNSHNLGLNYSKVLEAGLLHDCAKKLVHEPNVDKQGVPEDSIGTPVEHQFLGAIIAEKDFGVDDEDVLNAIKYHTTGKADMTTLEKLIYCADLLEEGREYDFLVVLRNIMENSFNEGFIACITQQYEYLMSKGSDVYPLTIDAEKFYTR